MKIVLLALLCAAVAAPAAFAKSPTLTGTVGPGFTITLKQGSKSVKTMKAGTYTFKISDKSNIHNFHLTGPGVNKTTSVGGTGSSTWKLKLKKGTYKYVCDPHKTIMKGSFKVT
ncbi:MAG TPA: plastocyanin/azurin family copper-binding protein [Gaiellaceae bacterium]